MTGRSARRHDTIDAASIGAEAGITGPFRIVDVAGATDVGAVRHENQDRYLADPAGVLAVADGIGGRPGGRLAADAAIATVAAEGHGTDEVDAVGLLHRLDAAVTTAGHSVGNGSLGTTVAIVVAHHGHVVVAAVGDSRVYRWRDGELEQLTVDHNVGTELAAAGVVSDQADRSGLRLDALTAHLGPRAPHPVRGHVASYSVMADDRFVVCTDGVHGVVPHAEMASIAAAGSCRVAVDRLLAAARAHGGRDNAAAVVARFGRDRTGGER